MNDPGVNPVVIPRYFDAAHHALDHQEVTRAVVSEGEQFYLLAQSYGGVIGMRYLTMPEITPSAQGRHLRERQGRPRAPILNGGGQRRRR